MGKIKKILENELVGGTQSTDIYPITSTKAVYDTGNKVLDDYIQHLKKTSTFAGIATPTTNPGTPDSNVFYIATEAGTYSNFNGISVANGEVVILEWKDGIWTKKTTGLATEQEVIYDVSSHNNGAVFESLQALLSSDNLNTLIPTSARHGGMTIRFIQGSVPNSDNKYVQYRLMSNTWSTTVSNWQGVDEQPIIGSDNLVKSGGVYEMMSFISHGEPYTYNEKIVVGTSKESPTITIEHQKVNVTGSLKKNNQEVVTEANLDDYYTSAEVDEKIVKIGKYQDSDDYSERIVFGLSKSDPVMIVDKDGVVVKELKTLDNKSFIVESKKELLRQNSWKGLVFAGYGDSITAGFNWGTTVQDFFQFFSKLNRGIGGTSIINYNKDNTIDLYPSGTQSLEEWKASPLYDPNAPKIRCCQAMSSWSRIKASFPTGVKEDIRLVLIMGGTNDFSLSPKDIGDNLLPQWSDSNPNCLYDTEWIVDSTYNPEAGDFNTQTSFKGAIASLIVKMQRWMPKARLVLVSQLSGRGVTGENATNFMFDGNGHSPLDYAYATKEVADMMSIPYIPLFENVGINQFNRKDFIEDGVHPYGVNYENKRNGQSQIARVIIGYLNNIFPYSLTYHDELNN